MRRPVPLYKPALAWFLALCFCSPGIAAAKGAAETASKPPISRAELLRSFKAGKWVENRRIRGRDLVALMAKQPVKIRIRKAIIEGGLDFSRAGAPKSKSIFLTYSVIRAAPKARRDPSSGFALYAPDMRFPGEVDLTGTHIQGPALFSRASFSGGPVNLIRTRFTGPVDFAGTHFETTVQAQKAVFEGRVYFSDAQFKNRAVFTDIAFQDEVYADKSIFMASASFRNSRFEKGASFRGARFEKNGYFIRAFFGGNTLFHGAVFSGPGKFDDAAFDAGAWFEGAVFHQAAAFNKTGFREMVFFSKDAAPEKQADSGATFHGEASFILAKFARGGRFTGVHFQGRAAFLKATFGGPAQFSDSVFRNQAWFTTSAFEDEATFQRADFKGKTHFGNANFEGFSDFLLARFHDETTFNQATFAKAAMLEADFDARVDFRGARFAGRTDFAGRTFRGPADFQASIFEARAVFRSAAFLDLAQFKEALFLDTLVLDDATFSRVADFRGARIARLAFNCRDRPTVIAGRVDFRKAKISACHFQDLIFASNVDLSDAVFGISIPESETTGDTADPNAIESPQSRIDGTAIFRYITFESDAYFIRTHFAGPLSLETVSFRGFSDWREAAFGTGDDKSPLLTLSYVSFSEANLRWMQLPPIARWTTGTERIPSFLEPRPAAVHPMQPRSQILQDLVNVFRRHNRLADANQVHYHLKRARLMEVRRHRSWADRWPLELEWAAWGLSSGYGTRLSWIIGWCLFFVSAFAGIYAAFGEIHRQPAPASGNDFSLRLRLLELPRAYLEDAAAQPPIRPRLGKFINALRLSAVILFKVGYRDTRITGRKGGGALGRIVALEWLIGFFLIGILVVTLTNTQPVLHALLSRLF